MRDASDRSRPHTARSSVHALPLPLALEPPMARAFSGRRLRTARRTAGLTAEQVAARVGRTPYTVWGWERGNARPSVDVVDALANAVGVSLADLLADDRTSGVAL